MLVTTDGIRDARHPKRYSLGPTLRGDMVRSEVALLAANVAATVRRSNRKPECHGPDPSPVEGDSLFSITGQPGF